MTVDRCVHCGKIIPEGRMICWGCEHGVIKFGDVLQSNKGTTNEKK